MTNPCNQFTNSNVTFSVVISEAAYQIVLAAERFMRWVSKYS